MELGRQEIGAGGNPAQAAPGGVHAGKDAEPSDAFADDTSWGYRMVAKLLDMAAEAGADAVVCGCPMCQSNLDSWQADISRETGKTYEIPIFFFTELMGLAFGLPESTLMFHRQVVPFSPVLARLPEVA